MSTSARTTKLLRWYGLGFVCLVALLIGACIRERSKTWGRPTEADGGAPARAVPVAKGNGGSSQPKAEVKEPRFDAADADATMRWLHERLKAISESSQNDIAKQKATEAFRKELADLAGAKVVWRLPVHNVRRTKDEGTAELLIKEVGHPIGYNEFLVELDRFATTDVAQSSSYPYTGKRIAFLGSPSGDRLPIPAAKAEKLREDELVGIAATFVRAAWEENGIPVTSGRSLYWYKATVVLKDASLTD